MTHIAKFLRTVPVRRLLEKARQSLGDGVLSVSRNGDAQCVVPQGAPPPDPADSSVLTFEAEAPAGLCMLCQPGAFPPENAAAVLELALESLTQLVELELARRSLADEALNKYRELALLHRSVPRFNTSLRLNDVVRALLNECRRESLPGESCAIFLNNPGKDMRGAVRSFGRLSWADLKTLRGSTLFSDVIGKARPEIINDLAHDERWDVSLSSIGSLMAVPLVSPNRCEGMLILASSETGVFQAAHRKHLATMASVAGTSLSNAFHFEETQILMDAMLQALAEAIDSRDPFTAGHSRRVAQLAAAFAREVGRDTRDFPDIALAEHEIREVYYAGILHDVGKIGIREEVLTKDSRLPAKTMDIIRARMELFDEYGEFDREDVFRRLNELNQAMTPSAEQLELVEKLGEMCRRSESRELPLLYSDECACLTLPYGNLTESERSEIERHSAESERILNHIPLGRGFPNLLNIIRQHHERLDGSGYPDGLRGGDILFQSRLLAVVDVFDAVTQERHYKPAMTTAEAVRILRLEAESGKLDMRLVDFFVENVESIERQADRFGVDDAAFMQGNGGMPTQTGLSRF